MQQKALHSRVLVVDDDSSFREVLAFHLQEEGYRVDLASDGEDALRLFDPMQHAVVVTDMKMPRMGGMDQPFQGRSSVGPSAPSRTLSHPSMGRRAHRVSIVARLRQSVSHGAA